MRDTDRPPADEVVLGEDWVSPDRAETEVRRSRERRGLFALNRSPLARKIITFNLIGLLILVAGVFYLNPFRDSLVVQREAGLAAEAELVADVFEVQISPAGGAVAPAAQPDATLPGIDAQRTLEGVSISGGAEAFVFGRDEGLLAAAAGPAAGRVQAPEGSTLITDFLNAIWDGLSYVMGAGTREGERLPAEEQARALVAGALAGETVLRTGIDAQGGTSFAVATPVLQGDEVVGVVALVSASGEIDALVRSEREQVLQMFVIAILVSIGLSLVLASTIANPLSDLAAAAELGRDRQTRNISPGRVRIPDLSGRPDEIGRLSAALRGMVAALYDRIDANEHFAADVAHEIKNPLASLRSAVGTLRLAKRDDQRARLCDVIEHDVRRLDRLVSDISNASRLDSELVKEEEEAFDLVRMLNAVCEHHAQAARENGVEFITDMPRAPMMIYGLEARLAQVFVNLVTNAVSFCEEGDAVRVWARRRENRVLVVVEDTGPGIPEQALTKIFNRFYSERPPGQFGDHSGLGLAISKQIVEAHGGVIWAENIRPTDADLTSEPLGARFVVGLPV
ncbi:MAG: sensor histidine kinase [Paracoccaceae bacterium]|nr:sensor histidine kinase [Paracoccaceae bacterium]